MVVRAPRALRAPRPPAPRRGPGPSRPGGGVAPSSRGRGGRPAGGRRAPARTCGPPPGPCPAAAGSPSGADPGGATVSYQGQSYRAKWWTQNNVPGAEQYGPWQALGAC